MTRQKQIGDEAAALDYNPIYRLGEGYGHIVGCGVTIGGSTTDIELQVGEGQVFHDGSQVKVSAATVTLADGVGNPRKDLVWVDRTGTPRVRQGEATSKVRPPGRKGPRTWDPAPPDGSGIDGVPLKVVWVPGDATSSGDLDPDLNSDARVPAISNGSVPELDAVPPADELLSAREWYNTTASAYQAFKPDTREVIEYDYTVVTTLGAPDERVVEPFEAPLDANWEGGESEFDFETPQFEGDLAAAWKNNSAARDYSLPSTGGLSYYAEPGDQAALAVRFETGDENWAYLSFGKSADDYFSGYRARLTPSGDFRLQVAQDDGSTSPLASMSISNLPVGEYVIIEVDYDGGGTGVHPCRVHSTSNGSRDSVLGELSGPTADETFRGRGYAVGAHAGVGGTVRLDRLAATPDGA